MKEDYVIDKNIKKSIFTLKPGEVKNIFHNTKKFIKAQYFNKATISINKVLHSNAGMIIKERFKILKSFISSLETFKLKDNIHYSTLMNLPLLYEDIQVVWKGKIEDISIDEDAQTSMFNIFVKENKKTIGMAKIVFKKILTNLTNGKEVILSGKFLKIDEKTRNPIIEGIGIK